MVFLFVLSVMMVPVAVAIYGTELALGFPRLCSILLLGAAAISAPGTLYSAIAAQARARDVLLPLLLFPILVPGLLAAVKATALVMHGDAMQQLSDWSTLLGGFALIYWILCTVLFGRVIEE
ncbi:MAG: heme exporter protein CcmB [Myxococcota bacterium]